MRCTMIIQSQSTSSCPFISLFLYSDKTHVPFPKKSVLTKWYSKLSPQEGNNSISRSPNLPQKDVMKTNPCRNITVHWNTSEKKFLAVEGKNHPIRLSIGICMRTNMNPKWCSRNWEHKTSSNDGLLTQPLWSTIC